MNGVDKHRKLEEQPFAYRITKDGQVSIRWHDRQIMTLRGRSAEKFITSVSQADLQQAQLLMARVTGHF
jgi:hypothetical protein